MSDEACEKTAECRSEITRALSWVGFGGAVDRRHFIATTVVGLMAVLASCRGYVAPGVKKQKVLLDTDIGSDIDDAIALSYLLAQPRCELLGITTVTGEAVKRAEMASALCHVAGQSSIPIYPGAELPLVTAQRQPHAPQYATLGDRPHEVKFPRGQAVEFLRQTIRAHPGEVTLLAIGPLTNLALLLRADPEIPRLLKELVMMCGSYRPQHSRTELTEWNASLDPEATAVVFRNAPAKLRSYGLDVTHQVAMTREDVTRRFAADVRLRRVLDFAQVWFARQNEVFFHDPLAAVSIFEPEICGLERGNISVDLKDGPEKGRTLWQRDRAGRHEIAVTVDPSRFFTAFFSAFNSSAI